MPAKTRRGRSERRKARQSVFQCTHVDVGAGAALELDGAALDEGIEEEVGATKVDELEDELVGAAEEEGAADVELGVVDVLLGVVDDDGAC